MGQNGVHLRYVICEKPYPNYDGEYNKDFEQLYISCDTLSGIVYKTDVCKLNQLIHRFVQGDTSEIWIKPRENKRYGRVDIKSLHAHYGGKCNKAVRIKEEEVLMNTLHCKK